MTNKPDISIVITTYNQEGYILECLESITGQTRMESAEVIICNDASTDHTGRVIEDFIRQYKGDMELRYFNQSSNLGIANNLIFGLSQCKGRYTCICEGDDYWIDDHKVIKQMSLLKAHDDCAMVISNRLLLMDDGRKELEDYFKYYQKDIFGVEELKDNFVPGMQTMLFPNNQGLVEYLSQFKLGLDIDRYLAYYFANIGRIYLLRDCLAVYRVHHRGAWSGKTGLNKLQEKTDYLIEFYKNNGFGLNSPPLQKQIRNCIFTSARYYIKRFQFAQLLAFLSKYLHWYQLSRS